MIRFHAPTKKINYNSLMDALYYAMALYGEKGLSFFFVSFVFK